MAPMKVTLLRHVILPVVAFAAMLLCAPAALAALQFDVFLGYDDIVPERSWFPITCELNNDGPPFNATIEVSAGGLNGTPLRRAAVDLPTGTRKRIFLPIFSSGNSWDVRLVDESGKVLAEQSVQRGFKPALRGFPVVAGLARNMSGLPVFPDVLTRQQQPVKFNCARLQTALFPDNPLALDGINTLYLNSSKALELTAPQVEALVAWVEDGGHLVVGVEQVTDVNGTPWLRNVLPCTLTSMTEVTAGETMRNWLNGAAPPAIVQEPPRRTPGSYRNPGQTFTMPSADVRNLPGVVVTLTSNGVSYRTNSNAPDSRRAGFGSQQFWLANSNGSVTRLTASSLSNLLALRTMAGGSPAKAPVAQDTNAAAAAALDNAPLQVATASLREGRILIGDAANPLAVQAMRGRGLVTVLAFSPEREPFLSWGGRAKFWMRISGIPQSMFDQQQSDYAGYMGGRMSSDAIFGAMIDSKQVHKLPLEWLLALLAAYLVVIGPLDQYWLKKINRQMLTWITFPCYVLLFSGLIYWIGFHLRNGELEWNELNIVDVLDSGDATVLRGQTYISIYSPINAHYKLGSKAAFATVRGEAAGNFGLQESSRAMAVQRGETFEADAYVPVWTSQLFVSDWLARGTDPATLSIERTGAGWRVIVSNNQDHMIGPLKVAIEGRVFDMGGLQANESKTNAFDRSQGMPVDAFAGQFAGAFRNAVQQRQSNFGNNTDSIPDVAAGAMAASLIGAIGQSGNDYEDYSPPTALDLTRYARSGYGVLLAWDGEHSVTGRIDQFNARRAHRRTLLRIVEPLPSTT